MDRICVDVCCFSTLLLCIFFFFKQKTAYEMSISDWSSDVCSSDLGTFMQLSPHTLLIGGSLSAALVVPVLAAAPATMDVTVTIPRLKVAEYHRPYVAIRSEERRVGKECVSTCRSRGSTYH